MQGAYLPPMGHGLVFPAVNRMPLHSAMRDLRSQTTVWVNHWLWLPCSMEENDAARLDDDERKERWLCELVGGWVGGGCGCVNWWL